MGYVTWNPDDKGNIDLSNGNLTATAQNGTGWTSLRATEGKSSGKWYWEITIGEYANYHSVGIAKAGTALTNYVGNATVADSYGWIDQIGTVRLNSATVASPGNIGPGDVIGIALDLENSLLHFSKNGVWTLTSDPANATGGIDISGLYPTNSAFPAASVADYISSTYLTANFGESSFQYTVPDGFSGLSSVEISFTFTNPSPTHQSTVYGTSQTLQLTVTVSGADTYDATFYNATTSGIIGSTISGTSSGQPVSTNWSTIDGGDYFWYLMVSSSGSEDTSSTYEFTNKFKCEGYVEIDSTRASGVPIRLYRRSTGELIGNTTSAGISGTFEVDTLYNENHYCIALHPTDSGTNALIYDHLKPGE